LPGTKSFSFENNIRIAFESERRGETKRNFTDISRAKTVFGFEPKTGLEEGLRKVYEWFIRQGIEGLRESRILSGSE